MVLFKNKQNPTYLHFLDRELRRAENADYSDNLILNAIIIAIINSHSYCYCNASLLLESSTIFPKSIKLLLELEKFELVKLLTNEHSFNEFIASRQKIYAHSSNRYPMYFNDNISLVWPNKPLIVNSSTTSELKTNIFKWLDNSDDSIKFDKNIFKKSDLKNFEGKLFKEKEKAITLDLFLTEEQLLFDKKRRDSGRLISYLYTKRYLDLYKGEILCNLPYLSFYDRLSSVKWLNDYRILTSILNCFYIPNVFFPKGRFNLISFISCIKHKMFRHIQIELISMMQGLAELTSTSFGNDINKALAYFNDNFKTLKPISTNSLEIFIQSFFLNLTSASILLSGSNESYNQSYHMTKQSLSTNKKVLIVTATQIEATTFLNAMSNRGIIASHDEIGKIVYWNLGIVNNCELTMIKTNMGSSGVSGSILSIKDAIDTLNPDFVIMVGIAFGLKKNKQTIGQILVSKELENYESAKITETKLIQRGDKIPSGITLYSRFDNSAFSYSGLGRPINFGFIISGDKLVDNKEFVEKLKISFPEAIGGEMEGTGLQSVCHREGKEWILIKGICDWGYNKQGRFKELNQKVAIDNVCDYLLYTLNQFNL